MTASGRSFLLALLLAAIPTGCAEDKKPAPPIVAANHDEPVIFNGQRYVVSFAFDGLSTAYNVAVTRPGKALTSGEEDGATASQVATSTVTHYACPGATKARPTDVPSRFGDKATWHLQLRCS